LAKLAELRARDGAQLDRDFMRNAIAELRAAQAWRDAQLADFDMADHRPLISKEGNEDRIGVEALIYTLRYAAIELLQVHKLLELRAFRKRPQRS
jgi:hypothetical protein